MQSAGKSMGVDGKVKRESEKHCVMHLPRRMGGIRRCRDARRGGLDCPWPGRLGEVGGDESVAATSEDGGRQRDFKGR